MTSCEVRSPAGWLFRARNHECQSKHSLSQVVHEVNLLWRDSCWSWILFRIRPMWASKQSTVQLYLWWATCTVLWLVGLQNEASRGAPRFELVSQWTSMKLEHWPMRSHEQTFEAKQFWQWPMKSDLIGAYFNSEFASDFWSRRLFHSSSQSKSKCRGPKAVKLWHLWKSCSFARNSIEHGPWLETKSSSGQVKFSSKF